MVISKEGNVMQEEDAVIEIFGTVSDAKALEWLAQSAEIDRLGTDWNETSSEEEIIEALVEAAEEAEWIRLVKSDAGDLEHTRAACREAGLSYIHSRGPCGGDGYNTASYWTPGMEREFTCELDGLNPLVPIRSVREASAIGNESVKELLAEYDRNTLAHVEKAIRFTSELTAEFAENSTTP
jgi:uncharacterized protein (DUF433 family)